MDKRRWHSSYPPGMPTEIELEGQQTVATLIEQALAAFAERRAVTCAGETLRYAELDRLSRALGAYLQASGLVQGDRVALMLPTSLPFLVGLTGVLRSGFVAVTVNPLYTAREVEQQLADSGATVVIATESLLPTLREVLPRTAVRQILLATVTGLQSIATSFADSRQGSVETDIAVETPKPELALAAALRIGHAAHWTPASVRPADPALLQYTGGTTGVSKGAVLTHRNVSASTAQILSWVRLSVSKDAPSLVTPLPLYHIYPLGVALAWLVLGGINRLVPNPRDTASVIQAMKQAPFEMLIAVNTLFNALVNTPELSTVDFSATCLATGAGASVQAAVARRWLEAGGTPITEAYGLSETSPSATFNPPGRNGTIGIPVPSTDVRIVDDEERDVALGAPGELLIRGPQLFAGYWNRPEETRKAFTADGWFKTGDVVTMDEAGFMYMVDRKKDMILVSGFNVYPNEIEAVVAMMPEVLECACVGVSDARCGEVPHLFAVPRQPELTREQIEAHCRRNLAAYKIPRHITLIDALPKSTVGKILRRELRQSEEKAA